jgi:hypothetical protein
MTVYMHMYKRQVCVQRNPINPPDHPRPQGGANARPDALTATASRTASVALHDPRRAEPLAVTLAPTAIHRAENEIHRFSRHLLRPKPPIQTGIWRLWGARLSNPIQSSCRIPRTALKQSLTKIRVARAEHWRHTTARCQARGIEDHGRGGCPGQVALHVSSETAAELVERRQVVSSTHS